MSYRDIFEKRGHLYNEAHTIAPQARDVEAEKLIQWLQPRAGETIIVTAAGGGYDTCRIAEYLAPETANIICVEPSERFSSLIPKKFQVFNVPLNEIPLPDGCADAVVNLAAMHHHESRDNIFDEWSRLLKPGGRMVIADVQVDTGNGAFLNQTVDAYTPGGHKGIFLQPNQLTREFANKDYHQFEEQLESYLWNYKDQEEMISFSRSLFGMVNATDQEILSGVKQHLGIIEQDGFLSVAFPWSLRFFRAFKL
ncbi:methyltransferase domain-containing protein [Pseudomonadota bacterium]|nr:methyltransferase domain-containing protein [Pseudomonadota bacterium]